MLLWSLFLIACSGEESKPELVSTPLFACGDGKVDTTEECDNGTANSDSSPGACRSDCRAARCGDLVVDAGESCDDGPELWGGDGCDPACQTELGPAEVEPNDDPETALPVQQSLILSGSLPEGDRDCYTLDVPACGAISVQQQGDCDAGLLLALLDPSGAQVAAGGRQADGCALLDPAEEPGARWVAAGSWTVCVSALNHAVVQGYTLEFATPDPIAAGLPTVGEDTDSDQIPDSCDSDIDSDGLENSVDNCPEVSNGPTSRPPQLTADGFLQSYLSIGPFTTGVSGGSCQPSPDFFVEEDGLLTWVAGDQVSGKTWIVEDIPGGYFNLLDHYGGVSAPREAYTLVYLYSEAARALTLSVGADDGVFGWWNGEKVLDISSCQGVNVDQFQAPVNLQPGWNQLLLKVYDQGGGFGLITRFYDENGAIVTDLSPSLRPDGIWTPDQSDRDGDGLGDVCDPTP
jgi:cysteine-rich repeat protein